MIDRLTITNQIRFKIFQVDDYTCQYCGEKPPNIILRLDHVFPVCRGGTNDIENVVTCCHACNVGKRNGCIVNQEGFLKRRSERIEEFWKKDYLINQVSQEPEDIMIRIYEKEPIEEDGLDFMHKELKFMQRYNIGLLQMRRLIRMNDPNIKYYQYKRIPKSIAENYVKFTRGYITLSDCGWE